MAASSIEVKTAGGGTATLRTDLDNGVHTLVRMTDPAQQAALLSAIRDEATVFTVRDYLLTTNNAHTIFPEVATAKGRRFRNLGPGDAYWKFGEDVAAIVGSGNRRIVVGEVVTLPCRTTGPISFISPEGAQIEAEEWS